MSESLARYNPKSPFRSALNKQYSRGGGVHPTADTEELLKMAKDNIKNLKQKGKQVLYNFMRCPGSIIRS